MLQVNNIIVGKMGQVSKSQENTQVESGDAFLGMLFSILSNGNMKANLDEQKEKLQEEVNQAEGVIFDQSASLFCSPCLVEDFSLPGFEEGKSSQGRTAVIKIDGAQPAAFVISPASPEELPVLTAETMPFRQFAYMKQGNPIPCENSVFPLTSQDNSPPNQITDKLALNRLEVQKEIAKEEILFFTGRQVENRDMIYVARQAAMNTAQGSHDLLNSSVPSLEKMEELQESPNQQELKGDNSLLGKEIKPTALPQADEAPASEEMPRHLVKLPVQEFPREFPKVVFSRLVSGGEKGASEVVIHLEPQELGKMVVKLISNEGVVSVKIIAEHPMTRDLLENGLQTLRQSFSEQGIKPGRMEIELGGQSLSQQQFYQQHPNQQSFLNRENYSAKNWSRIGSVYFSESEEPGETRIQMASHGTVDYIV